MKVLYFHQHFSTPSGSTGIRSYEMAQRLLHHGHQVTMVCGSYRSGKTGLSGPFKGGRRDGIVDGIHVIEFDLAYSNHDGFVRRSWQFLKYGLRSSVLAIREQSDVVFATSTPLTACIPGILARWLGRRHFVFEVRDLWPEIPKAMGVITNPIIIGVMSFLEWAAYKSAYRCIALSPGMADGIARRGISRDRIAMIPNGCDFSIFQATDVSRWRPEGVKDTDLMTVFAGTHGVANGLSAVLDAAAVLRHRNRSDIKFVLIGDGKLKNSLMERARAERLTNVVFVDPVDKARLAGLVASSDLGIQCLANVPAFYYGTSPNKFFDYIAAGKPVITNYPGWLADLVRSHEAGFAVPPEDPESFADALELAARDRAKLPKMGANALQLAKAQFDRHTLADEWVNWVVGQRGG